MYFFGGENKVVAVSMKREIGEERLRGVHTRKKRGVYTSSIFQKKNFYKTLRWQKWRTTETSKPSKAPTVSLRVSVAAVAVATLKAATARTAMRAVTLSDKLKTKKNTLKKQRNHPPHPPSNIYRRMCSLYGL